jgi:hypothetical protein
LPSLKKALFTARLFSVVAAAILLAAGLVVETGFALQCRLQRHRMNAILLLGQQRADACLALKWRWEADDQEHQYMQGSSAGSQTTVGPIAGYVMDVTENQEGHAEGYCHAAHASYRDFVAEY